MAATRRGHSQLCCNSACPPLLPTYKVGKPDEGAVKKVNKPTVTTPKNAGKPAECAINPSICNKKWHHFLLLSRSDRALGRLAYTFGRGHCRPVSFFNCILSRLASLLRLAGEVDRQDCDIIDRALSRHATILTAPSAGFPPNWLRPLFGHGISGICQHFMLAVGTISQEGLTSCKQTMEMLSKMLVGRQDCLCKMLQVFGGGIIANILCQWPSLPTYIIM